MRMTEMYSSATSFYLPVGKKADEIERMESEICTVGNIDEISADVLETF